MDVFFKTHTRKDSKASNEATGEKNLPLVQLFKFYWLALLSGLIFLLISGGFSAGEASIPSKIVNEFISNYVSVLMKLLWSVKATTKTAIYGRPMMRFESGYVVETVFDGSKLGIEPHSVEVLPSGELLVLDSANSNLYKISSPFVTMKVGDWIFIGSDLIVA